MGLKTSELLENFLVDGMRESRVSKWYVDTVLEDDLRKIMEMMDDADRDALEFEEVMTRVSEVLDKTKLTKAYNVIGLLLSLDGGIVRTDKSVVDMVKDDAENSDATNRKKNRGTLELMRESVENLLKTPVATDTTLRPIERDVSNRLSGVLHSANARIVKAENSDERVGETTQETFVDVDSPESALSEKERELEAEGYRCTLETDDVGNVHRLWSKSYSRYVPGYLGMKEVMEVLGRSEPYVKRIALMIGAVTIRNRFYADAHLVERVRSEQVAIKKVGSGYMSVTDFSVAANMTRRGALRVIKTKLKKYKERNMHVFVKRDVANKFIRENVEQVPNPFEYVTVREIEYATGILLTSEYTDAESVASRLSLKYRNNRMILISELLRMLEAREMAGAFNVRVRNELLIDYMSGYVELKDADAKSEFRKEAGVYGRYLLNMDDLEDPKTWLKDMIANDSHLMFAKVKEMVAK